MNSVRMCFGHCLSFLSDVFYESMYSSGILLLGWVNTRAAIRYLQWVSRHCFRSSGCYSRLVWSKIIHISRICYKPQFVYCVGTCHSAILCVKKLSWSETSLSKGAKYISTVYWGMGKRMRELFYWCAYSKSA